MRKIYLDNGATSFPKAPDVANAISNYITNIGCNINRGAYFDALEAEDTVFETRELLCDLFNFNKCENVIFTPSITYSLNMILKGMLKNKDHIIISSMEHNAVMRPLSSLENDGVTFSKVQCNSLGYLKAVDIENAITPNTKAVVITHASNVCGSILPLKDIGSICKKHNLIFIVDSAQSAGTLNIDMMDLNIDVLCFTGHKGLLGPQGIGGFLIKENIVPLVKPIIEGGTGSLSELEVQPTYMPDKFESGTSNIPGIFGLNASLKYLNKIGVNSIYEKELELTKTFIEGIKNIDANLLVGSDSTDNRTAVVSLDFKELDNGIICHRLNKEYGISTRSGLHCAPSAHKTLGTFPDGTVRFSFGHFNTVEDIKYTLNAINNILLK
ncbi:aminotransferase class V-fold PLP-dependent enzyme [Clostridium senegalense]|uniref:aminotransferase class V-fold PLP-dependent enzyme n=1 Tax=Clostridium senegalense TaxID=1465809 RepID=UPI001C128A62|nr:aminotransferase class V-fold PLP-dependent enzyme [Clostridium senegalense]MBU5228382.1 aminotransferase class V-fold PLP-dependent enzyme [Clostridium senegalense]